VALNRLYQPGDLGGGLPVDKTLEGRTRADRPAWVQGFNLSPFAFEIQDEGGTPRSIAWPFAPFKHKVMVRTEKINFHAIAQQTINLIVASAQFAVYAEISEHEQDVVPGPG